MFFDYRKRGDKTSVSVKTRRKCMIDKLTESQEKFLIKYREEMLRYGRSTEPSDRKSAEKSIIFFYGKIKKNRPKFYWFDSPYTGIIAIELLKNNLKSNLGSNLESNLKSNLGSNL